VAAAHDGEVDLVRGRPYYGGGDVFFGGGVEDDALVELVVE